MPFFISEPCVDIKDMSCVEECPVDCIYEGERKLYINPVECIDCGACEAVCPESAVISDNEPEITAEQLAAKEDNARFFAEALPGRSAPLGNPGGARHVGPVGADTETVAALPAGPAA